MHTFEPGQQVVRKYSWNPAEPMCFWNGPRRRARRPGHPPASAMPAELDEAHKEDVEPPVGVEVEGEELEYGIDGGDDAAPVAPAVVEDIPYPCVKLTWQLPQERTFSPGNYQYSEFASLGNAMAVAPPL